MPATVVIGKIAFEFPSLKRRTGGRVQAGLYIRGLEQRFRALADNPLLGIERKELQPPDSAASFMTAMWFLPAAVL